MNRASRPRRILMILENCSFPEDTRVFLEASSLVAAGFETTVICPTGKSRKFRDEVAGIRVLRYPKPLELSGFLGYLFEFGYSMVAALVLATWVCIRYGFDAIHVHCPPDMNALVALPFKLLGKKFVVDLHDLSPELYLAKGGSSTGLLSAALRFFERLACRTANALISTNESQRTVQIDRGGATPQACVVVRNGPNDMFHPNVQPLPGLKPDDRFAVGYVGIIGVQDGVDYFIRTMAEVRRYRQDVIGIVVGDGEALADIKELATQLNVGDAMIFTGKVPFAEVPQHIACFDICITPDPSNPYNDSCTTIKTMEYMAMGRPTVAFDTAENRVTAGDAALYAPDNDVEELARLIMHLIDHVDIAEEMARCGRERVEKSLAWKHQQQFLINLYGELLGRPTEVVPQTLAKEGEPPTCHTDERQPVASK